MSRHRKVVHVLNDRELSWLSFNERVLQEAEDPSVPVGDRLNFLGIVSSNLDEFFRVRVASLRSLLRLGKKRKSALEFEPKALLREIHARVDAQQIRFGRVLREQILPALREKGIALVDERGLDAEQRAWLAAEFATRIRPHVAIHRLARDAPFLENQGLYLVVDVRDDAGPRLTFEPDEIAIVTIPSGLPRFLPLPERDGTHTVMFLDDVIRMHLPSLFPGRYVAGAWSIKLTRDAELYLEDEFSGDLVEAIRRAVNRRQTGEPTRFLHDPDLPPTLLAQIREWFDLEQEDVIAGGRYHNLHDLMSFPRFDAPCMTEPALEPIAMPRAANVFDAIRERDRLVHFPYHSFDPLLELLDAAAADDAVESIQVTLYRVARGSAVVDALERAARRGKRVTAFVEVKARFDEETNLGAGARLERAGAQVLYSMPGLKVHAKLLLVRRREGRRKHNYAWLGTGNFNERTARVYADHGLLTADPRLTKEVARVFDFLAGRKSKPRFEHLLVAPFTLRKRLRRLVRAEMEAAAAGQPSGITVKLNSLEDPKAIGWLYEAAAAGVPIRLIVRGICRLIPPDDGSIEVRSIIDRFLEHARIYRFHAGGDDLMYLASADWMTRNLDRRVEVAFPIFDPALRAELAMFLDVQLADNVKARRIDAAMSNTYIRDGGPPVRAQLELYRRLAAD